MPGRKYNSSQLVNGFNGKRYDNEVYGEGNFQDYGMRVYDPRIVRLNWSVDPLTKKYPELSPYQFASNTPIQAIDLDGAEAFFVHGTWSNSSTWAALSKENYKSINEATGNKTDFTFDWKYNGVEGPNLDRARQRAGRQLANTIIRIHKQHPDEPITIVGHSHGGNVGIIATNILAKKGYKVNYLVTINTPVREYQLNNEAQKNTKQFNIYDPNDPVQANGGNKYKVLTFWYGRKGTGEFGPAERTFDNASNLNVYCNDSWYSMRGVTQFFDFGEDVHNSHNKPELWRNWLYSRIQGGKWYSSFQQQQGELYQQRSQSPGYNPSDNTHVATPAPQFPDQRKE